MPSISCFLQNPLAWMPVLGLLATLLLGYGFSSIFLTSILTLSTLFFNFSRQKQLDESPQNELTFTPDHQEIAAKPVLMAEEGSPTEEEEEEEEEEEDKRKIMDDDERYLTRTSPAVQSESECQGRSSTSEDSEVENWAYQEKMFRSPDCSDGSISDEDSLIEIALPSGHYIGHYKEEDPKKSNLHKKLPESFVKQHSLVELLAEVNEEDNLIEIDLSMGSIKCPRFEIQA